MAATREALVKETGIVASSKTCHDQVVTSSLCSSLETRFILVRVLAKGARLLCAPLRYPHIGCYPPCHSRTADVYRWVVERSQYRYEVLGKSM